MQTIELHKTMQSEKYNKRNKKKEMKKGSKKISKKEQTFKRNAKMEKRPANAVEIKLKIN